jgi:2'-5' RNA ligase
MDTRGKRRPVTSSRDASRRARYVHDDVDPGVPRLFIAVPLAEAARAAVADLVADVRAAVDERARAPRSEVRWVRLEGLHLTLRFLGPTDPARIDELARIVDEVANRGSSFRVAIGGAGAFPSPSRPQTLWLGITAGEAAIAELAARLAPGLERAGWPRDDRPFRAHLTVARSDGRREGPLAARTLIDRAATFETEFEAQRIVLFESVTGGGPARYVERHVAEVRA